MGMNDIRIFRFDASSCNGCDIEVLGMLALGLPLDELGVSPGGSGFGSGKI